MKRVGQARCCFVRVQAPSLAPCNMFPTPNVRSDNISWLYDVLAENWIRLGLPDDTRDSIRRGAFYTTLVRPGLRLISLNMNYCAQDNFWLFINSTDPLDQLQWVTLPYSPLHSVIVHVDDSMVTIRRRSSREGSYYWTSSSVPA